MFRLGINYWPARSAMRWWRRFDAGEVERDFARIRSAGFDTVRIFLLWEDFQPAPEYIAEEMLRRLVRVADIAARCDLALMPTLFTGHMSGVNWLPLWAVDFDAPAAPQRFRIVAQDQVIEAVPRNWYVDEEIVEAQALLARYVAEALGEHPAVWAWDLGNENSNCVVPPSRALAVAWLERMAGEIRSADRVHPITIGLHMEDLEEDRKLGPVEAARVCDFLCMHGYPLYADWAAGPTDEALLPFLGLLTYWLGGREVLFEEFGAPTMPTDAKLAQTIADLSTFKLLAEDEAASYTKRALNALHRFGFMGAFLWCANDYDEAIWDEPPLDLAVHERFFGLWRADGSAKPAVAEISPFVGRERRQLNADFEWIGIERERFYANPRRHLVALYARFKEHFAEEFPSSRAVGE
ncbi:glycoside hydrolase 5 family protein [Pyrinomonas methylaliphatogenes]|jgi:endo-1,4-beta-mannosidase|uniref:Endo-beta-mannanase n=1 Tax=Pyrinomonas methylaliphatogenes TaxID=454194 RepID=A0A0B6WXU1_9BACT|nr:hypothetical protein [Pyrinomonas methylaliphatogenes]MBX5478402.1 hypothetical protein [Pyrinomonas methylaliphatogenes]CDM65547.1 endo-beta-mannanase [Pyrinomonas methylaliphatogenes]